MKLKEEILKNIDQKVADFTLDFSQKNIGSVIKVGDGVVVCRGLSQVKMGELVTIADGISGVVLNLKEDEVGIIVFGDYTKIKEQDQVVAEKEILSLSVSDSFLGRVIDPLGKPIDGKGKIVHKNKKTMFVEKIAPGIMDREAVNIPLQTGIKAIDAMVPIGRGQRELIIGDRNTGKTAIAVDTIINQAIGNENTKNKKVISIYVAIGQKQSKVAQVVAKLEEKNAFKDTIILAANSSDSVALQYIAPYAGCAIAEYFMSKGDDVLIVYDDLTKHAWAYRQISLILRRPSGREAYPGDVFYLHSRLLERACKLNTENGGGSITALPIIETQAQDISAFIPTNVISITDGQIYLESDLFFQGIRPAINVGLSVSRVGGAAQLKAVKQVAGKLRLELAQFNELSAFAQFGSDLDASSKSRIERGKRIIEILKQEQYKPVPVEMQILLIWAVIKGYLDSVKIDEMVAINIEFALHLLRKFPTFKQSAYDKYGLTENVEKKLTLIADSFFKKYQTK